MYFSQAFNVPRKVIHEYGAIDISLVCDMPLFIDPILIFNSDKTEYQELHEYPRRRGGRAGQRRHQGCRVGGR